MVWGGCSWAGGFGGSGGLRVPTLSVLCRARTACTFSLMWGFLLRRIKDLRHCSSVRNRCCPMRDSPPCFRHCIRHSRSSPAGSGQEEGASLDGGSPKSSLPQDYPKTLTTWPTLKYLPAGVIPPAHTQVALTSIKGCTRGDRCHPPAPTHGRAGPRAALGAAGCAAGLAAGWEELGFLWGVLQPLLWLGERQGGR